MSSPRSAVAVGLLLMACSDLGLLAGPSSDLPREVACGDAQFAAMSDDAAVTVETEGVLEEAIETGSREFTFEVGEDPAITVAYVEDVVVHEFLCNDVATAENDGELDVSWPAVEGTAVLELGEIPEPNACGERSTPARITLSDVRFRGRDGGETTLDRRSISGTIGWFPPGC